MKYRITAPNKAYNRRIAGVQFIDGVAETDNEWAAQWFSGREGFTVTGEAEKTSKKAEKSAK